MKNKPELVAIMAREGITPNRAGMALCPFHGDRSPSMKVYANGNRFHCFGCGAHGDVVDFIRLKYQVNFRKACSMLCVENGHPDPEVMRRDREKRFLLDYLKTWRKNYLNTLTDRLRELLNLEAEAKANPMVDGDSPWDRVELTQEIPNLEWTIDTLQADDRDTVIQFYEDFTRGA